MQKQKHKKGLYIALALALFVGAPVLGAILVQNFTQWDMVVADPPITKVAGADAALSDYLTVDIGSTISNEDDTNGPNGGTDTQLSHEEITFTCFAGDRTYYTDVLQLQNTTGTEDWDVTLTVEADLNGSVAVEDTFDAGNADIWLMTSTTDSTTAITEIPNPFLATLTNWDLVAPIQLEVIAGTLSALQPTYGAFTVPAGEQRQLALVVDCGADMVDGQTGTFRLTVASSPN